MKSTLGIILSSIYLVIAIFFISTQGLFGESFIALILGLPWSMLLAAFEYGNVAGPLLYLLVIGPIVLNVVVLYWIGSLLQRKSAPPAA